MQKKFYIILLSIFCLHGSKLAAQELNAQVQVITPEIQATNKQIYTTLETAVREFLNNRKWTDAVYAPEERIECQFLINIKDRNADRFSGEITISYSRPIFMSDYKSPVFTHLDQKFAFQYLEGDRMDFNLNSNVSNLTSILAYYTYIIIGLDRDTFSPLGGDPYFGNAQQIVGNAQGGQYTGWSSFDGTKNRFVLIDNLTSPTFEPLRTGLYQYHREGLDKMYEPTNHKAAKLSIKNALLALEKVNDQRRNAFLMQVFFDAKSQEIINIFSDGEPIPLADLKEVLIDIDANNSGKYEQMGRA